MLRDVSPVERDRRGERERQRGGERHRWNGRVRLCRERRERHARQVEPPLVDEEAALPAREELAVEAEQVVELEASFQLQQRQPLKLLRPESSASGASSAANGEKLSETSA